LLSRSNKKYGLGPFALRAILTTQVSLPGWFFYLKISLAFWVNLLILGIWQRKRKYLL
jgi:hypothetical protein